MLNVAILGAGELGAGIALRLAARDWPGDVVLWGPDAGRAAGKALDLLESNPILHSGTRVRGARGLSDLAGARLVVAAGPCAAGAEDELPLEPGGLADALRAAAPDALLLAAGDAPEALLGAARRGGAPPGRLLGTAPEALAAAWRRQLAGALGCSPQSVSVSLVGAPPRAGLYAVFASVAGGGVEDLLAVAEQRALERRLAAASIGPRALAAAAVAVLQDMARKSGTVRSCYAWSGGAYGARDLFLCAPAVLGRDGVERLVELRLDPARRVIVDRAVDRLAEFSAAP